jgi:hypothetical protein
VRDSERGIQSGWSRIWQKEQLGDETQYGEKMVKRDSQWWVRVLIIIIIIIILTECLVVVSGFVGSDERLDLHHIIDLPQQSKQQSLH